MALSGFVKILTIIEDIAQAIIQFTISKNLIIASKLDENFRNISFYRHAHFC